MQEKGFYPDYGSYSEEELAADEFFQKWVLMPDEENSRFWYAFLEKTPDQAIAVENACKLVKHLTETGFHIPFLSAAEKQALRSDIFKMIGNEDDTHLQIPPPASPTKWWLPAAGVILGVAALFVITMKKGYTVLPEMVKTDTDVKQVKEILLPDSSVVVLNGNSSVRYSEEFNTKNRRDIYLDGNAYFRVKKNPEKLFVVHTPQAAITVTGTEFNVNTRTFTTNVVLTNGSVDIDLTENAAHGTIGLLERGQTLTYNAGNKELTTGNVPADLYTYAWGRNEWHFENTPFGTVIELIEQFYGTDVVLNNKELNDLTISAVVSVKDYSTLIRVIEKTLDVSVTETRNKVFIN